MSRTINSIFPCSKQTLYQEVNIHPPSSLGEQLDNSSTYQLPHYYPNKKSSTLHPKTLDICTLASINKDNKVQINQQALQFISLYSQYQIIFCGVYGSRKSGKSTLIESLISINNNNPNSSIAQNKYDNEAQLKIHVKPLQVGQDKRLFLIEYSKAYQAQQLSEQQQKLLDILVFISNSLIFTISKQGTLNIITKQISRSAHRLKFHLKDIHFWPQNLYIVNTYNAISKHIGSIDTYFPRISLLLWIKGDSKPLANLIKDISSISCRKSFRNISNNFLITKRALLKLQQEQNLIRQQRINVEGIFQSIYQELSNQYLLYHYQLYDNTLQQYFVDEKPYSIDYLIDSFDKSRNIVLTHFKQNHINKEFTEQQMDQLEDYIGQRQRLINEVNKKKSIFEVHQAISNLQNIKDIENKDQIVSTVWKLRQLSRTYQHSGVQEYALALHEIIKNVEKSSRKAKKREAQHNSNYLKQLQERIAESQSQLAKIRQKNNSSLTKKRQFEPLVKKNDELKERANKLIRQIDQQKKSLKNLLTNKLSNQQKIDEMLATIRQMEQTVRQNNKKRQQVQRQYDFNPQIERLNRRLQKLQRNMNGEGSKLQSILNSEPIYSKLSANNNAK